MWHVCLGCVMPESTECVVRDGCLKEVHCIVSPIQALGSAEMGDMLGQLGG